MIITEKPDLNEDLLIHFGVRGMKWGHRKARPDEAQRKTFFSKRNAKIAGGVAVLTGAAIATYLLSRSGNVAVRELATVAKAHEPSPNQLLARAGAIAHEQAMNRVGNQKLTHDLWANSAQMNMLARKLGSTPRPKIPTFESVQAILEKTPTTRSTRSFPTASLLKR